MIPYFLFKGPYLKYVGVPYLTCDRLFTAYF